MDKIDALKNWLKKVKTPPYKDSTIKRYITALTKAEEWLSISLSVPVFDISTSAEFLQMRNEITGAPNYEDVNRDHGHGDLSAALRLYEKYVAEKEKNGTTSKTKPEGKTKVEMKKSEIIETVKEYIAASGFSYEGNLVENFWLSLKSKPFVILAGTSGTGKTRLVRLFAEAIEAEYQLVSVRPDWSDSSDLFGHVNLRGEFVPGAIIDFVKRASLDTSRPYILCLDEMNLARVEYYLSDFLSVIETRRKKGPDIITDEITLDKSAEKKYGKVIIPENLYVVGTVNMDEKTFPFSKKVLDRANTIEFSDVDLVPNFEDMPSEKKTIQQNNSFLRSEYIVLKTDVKDEDRKFVVDICNRLESINRILRKANAHVGYRVRDEIAFYMLNNHHAELLKENEAFDNELMQKILPRIQGSSGTVRDLLCNLFKEFAGDYTGISKSAVSEQMQEYIDSKECTYKKSAEKICYMMRRYEEDGFTSYWL